MPGHVRQATLWVRLAGEKTSPPQTGMALAEGDEVLDEAEHVLLGFAERPIEPAHLVILAVRVIVPALGSQYFISGQNHRNPLAQEQDLQEIFRLLSAQREYCGILRLSFLTTVPAPIVIGPVTVVLTVSLIVLVVITHQIGEGEPVVTRHKIDAVGGQAPFRLIQVATATEARRHRADEPCLAAHETAHDVAILAVPFRPAET